MVTTAKVNSPDIDFYYWPTPNGQKVAIFLEEAHLTYAIHPVDISKGVQLTPDFEKISPNNRMPALVDRQLDVSIFESGAILLHLAEKLVNLFPQPLGDVLKSCNGCFGRWEASGRYWGRQYFSETTHRNKSRWQLTAS